MRVVSVISRAFWITVLCLALSSLSIAARIPGDFTVQGHKESSGYVLCESPKRPVIALETRPRPFLESIFCRYSNINNVVVM